MSRLGWDKARSWAGLQAIERHLGDLMCRLDPAYGDGPAWAAAALMAVARRGDSFASVADLAERPFPGDADSGPALPSAEAWLASLRASPLVGDGRAVTPLVLDARERLHLYRYFDAEARLAQHLHERATADPFAVDGTALGDLFAAAVADDTPPMQAVAAFAAGRSRIAVVTGGPGTGKTWTVARMLALQLRSRPDLRVHLAAPTGKAAARMGESLRAQLDGLDLDPDTVAALPEATTVHQLLGYLPARDAFRRGPDHPLETDLVILDEASMVDLLLMAALFDAVPADATLVLLGDPHQLASVATGDVLGAVSQAAPGATFSPAFCEAWSAAWPGPHELTADDQAQGIGDGRVHLDRSRRFDESSQLGGLARAVLAGDGKSAVDHAGDALLAAADQAIDALVERAAAAHLDAWVDALNDERPDRALDLLRRFQILCGPRRGPRGVATLGAAVERALHRRGVNTSGRHYHGRPILITANDHGQRLFNGDVGICWRGDQGTQLVLPTGGATRTVPVHRIPPHETAWALTVHKSQGSEYDRVLLVLPEATSALATRELVYTAITRARNAVQMAGSATDLTAACERATTRASRLAELLLEPLSDSP